MIRVSPARSGLREISGAYRRPHWLNRFGIGLHFAAADRQQHHAHRTGAAAVVADPTAACRSPIRSFYWTEERMRLLITGVVAAALTAVGLGCDNGGATDSAPGPMDPSQPASGPHTEPNLPQAPDSTQPSPGDPVTGDQFTPEQPAPEHPAPGEGGLGGDP
jgi:hypothetical protein